MLSLQRQRGEPPARSAVHADLENLTCTRREGLQVDALPTTEGPGGFRNEPHQGLPVLPSCKPDHHASRNATKVRTYFQFALGGHANARVIASTAPDRAPRRPRVAPRYPHVPASPIDTTTVQIVAHGAPQLPHDRLFAGRPRADALQVPPKSDCALGSASRRLHVVGQPPGPRSPAPARKRLETK